MRSLALVVFQALVTLLKGDVRFSTDFMFIRGDSLPATVVLDAMVWLMVNLSLVELPKQVVCRQTLSFGRWRVCVRGYYQEFLRNSITVEL
ncbi:hypothetical protein EDB19DRAFT_1723877 [Suillus lakei]|nr:hypothetical protein EDB19DRAFT_1723877 [Suillus lakei]